MKTRFQESIEVYERMSLGQLKDLRDVFEQDLEKIVGGAAGKDGPCLAGICVLNSLIQKRIFDGIE